MSVKSKDKKAQNEDVDLQEPSENENQEMNSLLEDQQKRIEELNQEISNMKETHLRKAAEMENMKKRLQREREQIYRFAKEAAIEDFLPVSDDLVRTLDMMEKNNPDSPYLDGVKMILNKFDTVLEKNGVTRIDEAGVPFDVNIHDAMLIQKAEEDDVESGTVLQVIENGYLMGEKTLRHAKVIVSE